MHMLQMAGNQPTNPIPDPSPVPKLEGNNQAIEQDVILKQSDFAHRLITPA